jgi:hypothetical protein
VNSTTTPVLMAACWKTGRSRAGSALNSTAATRSVSRRHGSTSACRSTSPCPRGVVVPAGAYAYQLVEVGYTLAQHRLFSGNASASYGSFYGGTRASAGYNGRVGFSPHFALEPNLTINWVRLPYGDFTARLIGTRLVVSPSPRLAFSSLTQFNSSTRSVTSSVRMRWEYTSGSDLYVVFSDGRGTAAAGLPGLQNRSFAIKATRLFRF